jgi:L-alanine-DL-glutamate epimerase-like enolase superfamily enzyme
VYQTSTDDGEAVDQGDWQMLVKVSTDEGVTGWSDAETLAPAAVSVISGQGMSLLGFRTLRDLLIGEDVLEVERLWEVLYVGSAYYGRRGTFSGLSTWAA